MNNVLSTNQLTLGRAEYEDLWFGACMLARGIPFRTDLTIPPDGGDWNVVTVDMAVAEPIMVVGTYGLAHPSAAAGQKWQGTVKLAAERFDKRLNPTITAPRSTSPDDIWAAFYSAVVLGHPVLEGVTPDIGSGSRLYAWSPEEFLTVEVAPDYARTLKRLAAFEAAPHACLSLVSAESVQSSAFFALAAMGKALREALSLYLTGKSLTSPHIVDHFRGRVTYREKDIPKRVVISHQISPREASQSLIIFYDDETGLQSAQLNGKDWPGGTDGQLVIFDASTGAVLSFPDLTYNREVVVCYIKKPATPAAPSSSVPGVTSHGAP